VTANDLGKRPLASRTAAKIVADVTAGDSAKDFNAVSHDVARDGAVAKRSLGIDACFGHLE
jgi:hypothetical protein